MSEFWDRMTAVHTTGRNTIEELNDSLAAPPLQATIGSEETPTYVVVGTDDGLVRKTDEWQTTEVAGSSPGTCCLVTDRRSVFVVGSCPDPDVDGDYVQGIPHAAVDTVTVKNSLLTTRFSIRTNDGVRFSITPTESDGLEETATFVRRAQTQWVGAEEFFADFEQRLDDLTATVVNSGIDEAKRDRAELLGSISELGQSSSLNEVDLPLLDQKRAEAKQRVSNAMRRGCWQRFCDVLETGDSQFEQGAVIAATEAYRDGCELYQSLVEIGGSDSRLAEIEGATSEFQPTTVHDTLIDRLGDSTQELSATDVGTQVEGLTLVSTGVDRIANAIRDAGDSLDIEQSAIRAQLTELRQRLTVLLGECVTDFEERGDEAAESGDETLASQQYERALDALESQRRLVATDDAVESTAPFDERRNRLEQKIGRLEWQWVGDQ